MKTARFFTLIMVAVASITGYAQKKVTAQSPDGQTCVNVTLSDHIYYDVVSHNETLLEKSVIGMQLRDRTLGAKPILKKKTVRTVRETLTPLFPLKYSQVDNHYTLLTLEMKGAMPLTSACTTTALPSVCGHHCLGKSTSCRRTLFSGLPILATWCCNSPTTSRPTARRAIRWSGATSGKRTTG